jgi:integrase
MDWQPEVHVFSIETYSVAQGRERRRFRVRWRVVGRDRSRAFRTKGEAERFRSMLLLASANGERFDLVTGLPAPAPSSGSSAEPEVAVAVETWFTWTQRWVSLKWPHWAGHSRRSAVETLVDASLVFARPGAPRPPADLATWMRSTGYQPHVDEPATHRWLERWSIPLVDIDASTIEVALTRLTTRKDGRPMKPSGLRRRRNLIGSVLRAAVRRGLLDRNPMDQAEWRPPAKAGELDISTVPSPADVLRIADHVTALDSAGARYGVLFAFVGLAGLRPSEVAGLRVRDMWLPEDGWGLATLRGATTAPGALYSHDGIEYEDKGLKARADTTREVPLPPALVTRIRAHLTRWPAGPTERAFTSSTGKPVSCMAYNPVWRRESAILWPEPHPLSRCTVYDLRHGAATMMLRAKVPPGEVARRLGHSVDVLLRVYAGVFNDDRDRSNALLDEAFVELTGRPTLHLRVVGEP